MEYSCINNSCFNVLVCNSNICVSIGLVSMEILIIAYVFLSGNFWVDATHYMHFTLLCAGYYFIPISILELCSGVQLSYMGITWSFCVLLLWFLLRKSWTVVSLVLIMPYCEQDLSECSTPLPMIYEFFHLFDGKSDYSHPCLSTCTVPSYPFE